MNGELLALARRDTAIAELCFDIRTHIRDNNVSAARQAARKLKEQLGSWQHATDLEIIRVALHAAAELLTS